MLGIILGLMVLTALVGLGVSLASHGYNWDENEEER